MNHKTFSLVPYYFQEGDIDLFLNLLVVHALHNFEYAVLLSGTCT